MMADQRSASSLDTLSVSRIMEGLRERTEHFDIYLFPAHHSTVSISNVLFTGGRGVSDFSVLKYYQLNINYSVNILSECLRILFDCSQLSKMYYNVLFGSSTRDCHYDGRLSVVNPVTRQKTGNYNVLFGSSTRDHHTPRICWRTFRE